MRGPLRCILESPARTWSDNEEYDLKSSVASQQLVCGTRDDENILSFHSSERGPKVVHASSQFPFSFGLRYDETVLAARKPSARGQFRPVRLVLATMAHRPCFVFRFFVPCFFLAVSSYLFGSSDLASTQDVDLALRTSSGQTVAVGAPLHGVDNR